MLNTLTRCLIAGAALICVAEVFTSQNVAKAEPAASLLPLQARTVENAVRGILLDQVADTMNTQIAADQAILNAPTGISLESIPLIKELVDNTGKIDTSVDVGSDLPISVGFGDLMGNGVLVLGTDFSVN